MERERNQKWMSSPTQAVFVRVVDPLADPEDGDAGWVLGLL